MSQLRKIVSAESNCVRVHLEMFIFSLLIPELDGIPLAEQVRSVISSTEMNSAWLLSHGTHLSTWPRLSHVPSFEKGVPKAKDLCVGQLRGLLQFPQVPRHPIKKYPERAANWGISKGKWKTHLHKKATTIIKARLKTIQIVDCSMTRSKARVATIEIE